MRTGMVRAVLGVAMLGVLSIGAARVAVLARVGRTGDEMAAAARRFVEALPPEARAKAALSFDGPERRDWKFVPGERAGVMFAEMNDASRSAARDLLRSALSSRGVLKVEAIMALEGVLREVEKNDARDPQKYSVAVFGSPAPRADPGLWGWKIEGHHVSLNFTVKGGEVVSVSPSFLGANPAEVRSGPKAGARVLADEEDLARELMASLSDAQRRSAVIAGEAPPEVLSMPGRPIDGLWPDAPLGLAVADMTGESRALVERLIGEFARNLRHDLAEHEMAHIREAGFEKVRFCWAGGVERGRGHYYRVIGPTFVIEYDNTQNDGNHVHTVWHDRTRDFGGDALKEHLERDPHGK